MATTAITRSGLDPHRFCKQLQGEETALYVLQNQQGMEVCITNYGARIVSIWVPDRDGKFRDVVLAYDNIDTFSDKEHHASDFGAVIGRYANRIGDGHLQIDGKTYQLPQNNFTHCLHGGPDGWHYRVFKAQQPDSQHLILTLESPDGDANFPGKVNVQVTYHLTEDNALEIHYAAESDAKTVINLTNHSYFNLSGDPTRTIADHVLRIDANRYTPTGTTFLPIGEIHPVEGTPMDFRQPKEVGKDLKNFEEQQIKNGNGFDHNWCLNTAGDATRVAACVVCPATGIGLEILTTEPGVQIYTGNFLDHSAVGKNGISYGPNTAICLETQKYPDTPNHPEWPSAELSPERPYRSLTIFRFTK